jgi:hypothetical protein
VELERLGEGEVAAVQVKVQRQEMVPTSLHGEMNDVGYREDLDAPQLDFERIGLDQVSVEGGGQAVIPRNEDTGGEDRDVGLQLAVRNQVCPQLAQELAQRSGDVANQGEQYGR